MKQKYIKDNDGNIVLPITSVTAVRDNEGQTLAAKIEELELKSDGNNNLIKTEESRAKNAESSLHSSVVSTNNALNTERSERTAAEAQLRAELNAKQYEAEAIELDAVPTKDSTKMVNSGAVYTALQDMVYDVSVKHPASGVDSGNTYTLAGALAVLNANLSASEKKGGMSIKFIQSFDNKYVKFFCTADEFTTDTTQWAILEEGVYVENPEFVYVKTDAEGKILWGIKTDGGIFYGSGVPLQVKDYIEEKLAGFSPDEYEDIVAFLSDYLGSDTTLKAIIDGINDTKVDKEEGKSLIDAEYASTKSTIDNPEFLEVTTDSDDKILEGIRRDGTKVIELPLETQGVRQETISNSEFIQVITDSEGRMIEATKKDGKKVFFCGIEGLENVLNAVEKLKNEVKDSYINILTSFDNVVCVGDSLTYGSVHLDDSVSPAISRQSYVPYPKALARLCGYDSYTILARGGADAKEWWDSFGDRLVQKDNALGIIYLGTNEGISDSLDTDVVGDNPDDWADNVTGCYCRIVQKMISLNYKVLLIKPWVTDGNTANLKTTSMAIDHIGERFNCAVLESFYTTEFVYHCYPDFSGQNRVHYNDLGYSWFASSLIYKVNEMDEEQKKWLVRE